MSCFTRRGLRLQVLVLDESLKSRPASLGQLAPEAPALSESCRSNICIIAICSECGWICVSILTPSSSLTIGHLSTEIKIRPAHTYANNIVTSCNLSPTCKLMVSQYLPMFMFMFIIDLYPPPNVSWSKREEEGERAARIEILLLTDIIKHSVTLD